MPLNTVWDLIAKKLAGEATAEELGDLEILLRANPDLHYSMQAVADLWHQHMPDTEDAHAAFTSHAERMKQLGIDIQQPSATSFTAAPASRKKNKYIFAALSICLLFLVAYYSRPLVFTAPVPPKTIAATSEVSTRYGSRTHLLLPDGTQVWLNSGSKLSYDKTYGNGIREVGLSGEAYFDVVKNAAHPFVIHTSSIDIRVLGTAFNVKSFPGEKSTETSLIRGSIEVTFKNRPAEKIILKPNEKLITANEEVIKEPATTGETTDKSKTGNAKQQPRQDPLVLVSHLTYEPRDSTVVETSWMENKLIFRSETFEDLAIKMERWYGVEIKFTDDAIKPKRLNGIFENESIQQALTALQLITPFTYTINKNEIKISSR